MIEDGVHEFVCLLSLDDLVVHEARLLAHADSLHEPRRWVIAGVAGTDDPPLLPHHQPALLGAAH
jgi:hypothetical protein